MQRAKLAKKNRYVPPTRAQRRRPGITHYDYMGRTALEREAETLAFIHRFAVAHRGHMPTYREIMDAVGISSQSVCSYTLRNLVASGQLEYVDGLLTIPGSEFVLPPDATEEGAVQPHVAR